MTMFDPPAGLEGPVGELTSTSVIAVDGGASLRDVASQLSDRDVGFAVVDGVGCIAGVISERDIVKAVADGTELDEVRAEDIMSTELVTVESTDTVQFAVRRMLDDGVRHLLVSGRPRGVVSIRDLLAALSE